MSTSWGLRGGTLEAFLESGYPVAGPSRRSRGRSPANEPEMPARSSTTRGLLFFGLQRTRPDNFPARLVGGPDVSAETDPLAASACPPPKCSSHLGLAEPALTLGRRKAWRPRAQATRRPTKNRQR